MSKNNKKIISKLFIESDDIKEEPITKANVIVTGLSSTSTPSYDKEALRFRQGLIGFLFSDNKLNDLSLISFERIALYSYRYYSHDYVAFYIGECTIFSNNMFYKKLREGLYNNLKEKYGSLPERLINKIIEFIINIFGSTKIQKDDKENKHILLNTYIDLYKKYKLIDVGNYD